MSAACAALPASVELLRLLRRRVLRRRSATTSAETLDDSGEPVLGRVQRHRRSGSILGSALGYVLGGVLGRGTVTAVRAPRSACAASRPSRSSPARRRRRRRPGRGRDRLAGLPARRAAAHLPALRVRRRRLGLLGFRVGSAQARRRARHVRRPGRAWPPRPVPAVALPRVVDTSVAIDGRILDVVRAGFLHGRMLVPDPGARRAAGAGRRRRRPAPGQGPPRPRGARDAAARAGVDVEVLDDEVPGVRRGRRQAGADLPRPRRRPAHPRHQPGQGRRARRRAGA